ncbi:ESX secretion-associated protein EspG [Nocardia sp. AG03]|uniref:ESX secretion-associated protein EspG n=1 Tax=Nocardia sp. AG03 TaxID=3025312 RepID=UPI00241864BF|nr:ESX secretion-associated protein EspG [Nocardia sp. AG03]
MTRTWEFTDIEFQVLWQRLVGTTMPRPLSFVTEVEDALEFEQLEHQAWRGLRDSLDGELRSAIEVLARPHVYVRLRGWHDRATDDPRYAIKARAARVGARGYAVYQKPGRTPWHSAGYIVVDCGPHGLAEAIVGHMPEVGAGRSGIIALAGGQPEEHAEFAPRPSLIFEEADTGVAASGAAFFETVAERTGLVEILQNQSMFGSRGMLRDILVWRDLPDDGRYVIALPSEEPAAVPMARPDLLAAIDTSVQRMLARVESQWEARA